MVMTSPHKFEYNANEISITALQRRSLLIGFMRASEQHLLDLKLIANPSLEVQHLKEKLKTDIHEIRKEYDQFKSE